MHTKCIRGGESCDILRLMCFLIWTERVRKLFMIYLRSNEFSCSKVQIPCFYSHHNIISVFLFYAVTCCVFFAHSLEHRLSYFCSSCGKNPACMRKAFIQWFAAKAMRYLHFTASNSLGIKEIMINFCVSPAKQKRDICIAFSAAALSSIFVSRL